MRIPRVLHELLHRIKWNPEFGKGAFGLGYWDRVPGKEQLVRFEAVRTQHQLGDTQAALA